MDFKNELMFGAAYYNEYMPYERIETDLRLMKEAGMNTIRIAESTWSTEEVQDGVFNFKAVTDVLDCAQKLNMNVIVGTPTYAVPAWLVKKYPDSWSSSYPRWRNRCYGCRKTVPCRSQVGI